MRLIGEGPKFALPVLTRTASYMQYVFLCVLVSSLNMQAKYFKAWRGLYTRCFVAVYIAIGAYFRFNCIWSILLTKLWRCRGFVQFVDTVCTRYMTLYSPRGYGS